MMRKFAGNELTPFEKGLDFILYFRGKPFTLDDIAERYSCSYRQAVRMKRAASRFMSIAPAGFDSRRGLHPDFLWEFK